MRRLGICAAALLLASCGQGVLDPEGPVSAAERLILFNATAIMLVVVAPVIVMTLIFAWWFRASNARAVRRPDFVYSGSIELVVWSIPAMIVILLAGVTWISSHDLDPRAALPAKAQPLRIQVVSLNWKWLFIYPDRHLASLNELTVPSGTPLEFTLTSATVMNAFFVPQLGSLIYTMPGMASRLNLLADRPGDYPGMSAQFSGDGFSDMRFVVHALPPAQFEDWATHAHAGHPVLDADAYTGLARYEINASPRTYGAVDDMMFDHVLMSSATTLAAAVQ